MLFDERWKCLDFYFVSLGKKYLQFEGPSPYWFFLYPNNLDLIVCQRSSLISTESVSLKVGRDCWYSPYWVARWALHFRILKWQLFKSVRAFSLAFWAKAKRFRILSLIGSGFPAVSQGEPRVSQREIECRHVHDGNGGIFSFVTLLQIYIADICCFYSLILRCRLLSILLQTMSPCEHCWISIVNQDSVKQKTLTKRRIILISTFDLMWFLIFPSSNMWPCILLFCIIFKKNAQTAAFLTLQSGALSKTLKPRDFWLDFSNL